MCMQYFERADVVELVSSKLAGGLDLRLFRTFILDPVNPFETLDREKDLLAAARQGRSSVVKWIHSCMTADPKKGDDRVLGRREPTHVVQLRL